MPFFQLLWKYFEKKNKKWFTIIPLYLIHGLFIGSSLLIFIFFSHFYHLSPYLLLLIFIFFLSISISLYLIVFFLKRLKLLSFILLSIFLFVGILPLPIFLFLLSQFFNFL
jgi:hypothetical protein